MIQTFTPNDVLLFRSGELNAEEERQLRDAVAENPDLGEFSSSLELLESQMPSLLIEPGEKLVARIMEKVKEASKKTSL